MKGKFLTVLAALFLCAATQNAHSHCQMPCGIYHDEMVYDQIDQYAETMYKAVSELNNNKFETVKDRSQFVRWVMQKEKESDDISIVITTYFLQQKIKPDEPDTGKHLALAHKLLFLIVQIKQNADIKFVHQFFDAWHQFKLIFHTEGYECKIDKAKLDQLNKETEALKSKEAPVDDHEHTDTDEHDHQH